MANYRPGILVAVLLLWLPAAASAAERVLVVLQARADAEVRIEVLDKEGLQAPETPLAAAIWRLGPGDSLDQAERPRDRVIDLYSGTPRSPSLVARVVTRYFPSASGWRPRFRLDEQPAVVRRNGRWQPLLLPGGAGLLVRYGNTLPNAEGFFPVIDFGPAAGALALIGWQAR